MKLTGKLKETVAKAESKEQAREAIKKAGMILDDDELEMVSGGDMGDDDRPHYSNMTGTEIKRYVCVCGNHIEWNTLSEPMPEICPDCYSPIGLPQFGMHPQDLETIGKYNRIL